MYAESLSQMTPNKFSLLSMSMLLLLWSGFASADLDDLDIEEVPSKKPQATDLEKPDLGDPEVKQPSPAIQQPSNQKPKSKPAGKKFGKGKQDSGKEHNKNAPIQWKADGLKGTRSGQLVELQKNVVVTQADVHMTADRAKIYFNEADEVERVQALGNVRMRKKAELAKDQMSARGDEAIFMAVQRKVTLKGNAVLWRGGDVVKGKKIDYELDSGWIKVERVEGVVAPGEKPQ